MPTPQISAERKAAIRIAVPAADMKLKMNLAATLTGSWPATALSSALNWSFADAGEVAAIPQQDRQLEPQREQTQFLL